MTKNITAVLFALLLSTAVFAQTPVTSGGALGPSHQPWTNHPNSSSSSSSRIDEDVLEATNTIAAVFNQYPNAGSLPAKAKTFAHIKYNAAAGYTGLGATGTGGGGWPMPSWQHRDIPAVFVKDSRPNQFVIAVPASKLQEIPENFEYFVSQTVVADTERQTKKASYKPSKTKCPSGFQYRQANNNQETDLCLQVFSATDWFAGRLQREVFSQKDVSISMAAKALKK